MLKIILFACLMSTFVQANAQITNREEYDLKQPKDEKDCRGLREIYDAAPVEVRFGTLIRGDSVFLIYNDPERLISMIKDKSDGASIDLVQKSQYQCDNVSRFPPSYTHRGYLLPPVYRDQLAQQSVIMDDFIYCYIGRIPKSIKPEEVEANFLLINNKNVCAYSNIVNLDFHGWQLLKMGLFYDTLSEEKLQEKYKELSKTLRFTIPFEKNKAEYNKEDLRPMYDSLRMTDYAIKTISIHAYTSVEGSYERNEKLQQQRAQSIVDALQAYQSEKISSTITTSENWVEFLNDINGSPYSSWMLLGKDEIKEKLKLPSTLDKLENILRNHRKAVIEISLEKRLSYKESNPDELKKYFEQSIAQKNIDEALYLQNIIFFKIERHELAESFLDDLELPESIENSSLLINNAAFLFDHAYSNLFEAIKTFESLDKLVPNNPKIRYNLAALQIDAWLQAPKLTDNVALKNNIEGLRKLKIPDALVRRLWINYHIIQSEIFMQQRKFGDKDKSVKFIYDTYGPLKMNDSDLVNLSKYFSHYSKFEWARKILEPRIKSIDASEDLIFYYLNLTIFDKRFTQGPSYRTTMLNAVNGNRPRFCKLFDSSGQGGVSFQLLDNDFLKKTWCESCRSR